VFVVFRRDTEANVIRFLWPLSFLRIFLESLKDGVSGQGFPAKASSQSFPSKAFQEDAQ
jgi:hypothetical protein